MTSMFFGLLMFFCMVPVLFFVFISMYPRKWENKNRIFGVNNRPEFNNEKSHEFINIVTATHRKEALIILILLVLIAVALLVIPDFTTKMIGWSVYIYVAFFAILVPYALGNSEMKKYKKYLGVISEKVMYADLKNVGKIHSLNVPMLIIADILGLFVVAFVVLIDINILPINLGIFRGTFICTALVASIIVTNIIAAPIAFIVDNSRNDVISENSDINANYNRARKKVFTDFIVAMSWVDDFIAAFTILMFIFHHSEIIMIYILSFYLLLLLFSVFIFTLRKIALDKRYLSIESKLIEEDDDSWILGIFYFNPDDKRFSVEKRTGMGWTVNMAHPMGKLISVFGIITIVASLASLIWIGMMAGTPIDIHENDEYIICHHLWDEYKINKSEIVSAEYGNLSNINAVRIAGTGMENVAKGDFKVDGVGKCKFFLNPQAGNYIKIITSDQIYYISDNTEDETSAFFKNLSE
ncbi:MAG: DUF5808 domain-containing protein [Lachnospiraceae bacterium]|nr:DUF5808 domain-containing protein [Lachnospiraceae bacterium]